MDDGYWMRAGRLTRRRLLGGAGAAGLGVFLAACGGGNSNKNSASAKPASSGGAAATSAAASGSKVIRGGSFNTAISSDIANLDPLKSSLFVDRLIHYQMYDSLIKIDKDVKFQPGLALSWETSDPLNLVFKLRQGVKFHDGTDFNADAVKFNMDRILQTSTSPRQSEVAGLESIQVVDPTTVKFVLKAPFAPLLATLVDRAGMILSPTAIQKLGDNLTHAPTGAGTGAFKFVDYVKSDHLGLARNESWWEKDSSSGALPYLDKLTYTFVPDATQRLNSLKTGEIDFSDGIPPKDVEAVQKDPTLIYSRIAAFGYGGIDVNSSSDVFKDVRVRQAFAWAIDRQQIVDTVFFKINPVAYGPIAPPHFAFDSTFKPYTRDINKAKALLQQAGKSTVSFTMLITANDPTGQQEAELVKDQAKDAGIIVNLQSLDFPTLNGMTIKHQYEAALEGWSGRLDPDGNTYGQLHTGGGFNDGLYSSPEMDKALDGGRTTFDEAKRKTFYQQVNKIAADDAPYLYVLFTVTGQYSTAKVKNFIPIPDGIYRFYNVWKQA